MRANSKKIFFAAVFALLVFSSAALAKSSMRVPAVDANGEGILTSASVEVRPGAGEEYVNIVPFFSIETQQSSKAAISAAAGLARVERDKHDYFVKIVANAEVVDGPSGGAALAVLAYAEITGRKLRSDLAVTGSVTSDGGIGKVGGIFKKAEAAAKAGIKVLVVPPDQAVQDGVDLTTFAPTKWGMQVIEARKLEDIVEIAFTTEGSAVPQPQVVQHPLLLAKLNETTRLRAFKQLAERKLEEARQTVQALAASDSNAPLINASLRDLNASAYQLEQGYYYSAANNAFLAIVSVQAYSLANKSKADVLAQLRQLQEQAKALNATSKTSANVEWAFAAELRKYWALQRLDEAGDKALTQTDPALLAQSLAAAENWVSSVKHFNEIAAGILGGEAIEEGRLRNAAARKIAEAANESANSPDSEGAFHLSTARKAFSQGAYLTALADAVFAKSFAIAVKQHVDKTTAEALAEMRSESFYYALKSSWAQLYFSHALYSKAEWQRSGDASALLNALKLQQLALAMEELVGKEIPVELARRVQPESGEARGEATNATAGAERPPGGRTLDVAVVALPKRGAGLDSKYFIAGALAALVIAITALLYALQSRRSELKGSAGARSLEAERKLDQLDELLLAGKLGERNYERLKQKYSEQLKQASLLNNYSSASKNAAKKRR